MLFLFTSSQHFIDACDDLPGVLDRSLALLDLCQEALTFFLSFFDERRRRIGWYVFIVTHCLAPDQAWSCASEHARQPHRLSQICNNLFRRLRRAKC